MLALLTASTTFTATAAANEFSLMTAAPEAFAAAIQPNTKLVYTETIGNPLGVVADLERLAGEPATVRSLTGVDETIIFQLPAALR